MKVHALVALCLTVDTVDDDLHPDQVDDAVRAAMADLLPSPGVKRLLPGGHHASTYVDDYRVTETDVPGYVVG